MKTLSSVQIVTPVYNDWPSFIRLLAEIDKVVCSIDIAIDVLAVDDASVNIPIDLCEETSHFEAIGKVEVISMMTNQGHQRAIALGLAHTYSKGSYDAIIVMDSDGEDRPQDIAIMIELYMQNPDKVIVAQRAQRSEGCAFRMFYFVYKILFRILTGRSIDFGNFCLIGADVLQRLVHSAGTWNHFAATIMLSNFQLCKASTKRGLRYAGQSRMNTIGLIIHGLSAISVFSEIVVTRILIGSIVGGAAMILFILVTLYLRLFTDLAIPGWASIVVLSSSIILFQLISVSAVAALQLMNNRSVASVSPISILNLYIRDEAHLLGRKTCF